MERPSRRLLAPPPNSPGRELPATGYVQLGEDRDAPVRPGGTGSRAVSRDDPGGGRASRGKEEMALSARPTGPRRLHDGKGGSLDAQTATGDCAPDPHDPRRVSCDAPAR